jgi:hypothetical protein
MKLKVLGLANYTVFRRQPPSWQGNYNDQSAVTEEFTGLVNRKQSLYSPYLVLEPLYPTTTSLERLSSCAKGPGAIRQTNRSWIVGLAWKNYE